MSISVNPRNPLALASSMEIPSGVWIPFTPPAFGWIWRRRCRNGAIRGYWRTLITLPLGLSQAANSLQDDARPIGSNAPSGVHIQAAFSGQLADVNSTLAAAPTELAPRTPRTYHIHGLAHGPVNPNGPPGYADFVCIVAHLSSDDAWLAPSTTTGGPGFISGLSRGCPIIIGQVLAPRHAIAFAFFYIWFLAQSSPVSWGCSRRASGPPGQNWILRLAYHHPNLRALRPVMLPRPYYVPASSGCVDGRTITPGRSTASSGGATN
ncbi:hypothetical protein C8R44DRAFT_826158 [Mycena epipterygia]|nr:hypothetical protein C8R44DRAFT_826158 [Mycena epipterygia]